MPNRLRLQPHRTASGESITWGPWWVRVNGERQPLSSRLPGWDYVTPVSFESRVVVDVPRVLQETGLSAAARLKLVALIDCPATLRRSTVVKDLDDARGEVELVLQSPLEPGEFATSIDLSRHLVLQEQGGSPDADAPSRCGARLAESDTKRVALEGEGARFPIEAVPFSRVGMEPAAWVVDLTYEDLNDSFMGSVRLVVNTEHPAGQAALRSEDEVAGLVQSVLRIDVTRQLLTSIADDRSFDPSSDLSSFEDDSIGAVMSSTCDLFLRRGLGSVVQMIRTDRQEFEAILQARMDYLRVAGV